MIVTEEVAKTKFCHRSQDFTPHNPSPACRASNCMAWKWANGFSPEELKARSVYNPNPDVPKGYCGA